MELIKLGIRVDKINYYLDIAEAVSKRSTCLLKKYGAVIVNNDEIISTGYNGAPRGMKNCIDIGICTKKKLLPNVHHSGYDACRALHAEQNAIISASRTQMLGGNLYLVGIRTETEEYELGANSCLMCRKMIINAGISKIFVRENKEKFLSINVKEWIEDDDLLNGRTSY